MGKVRIAFVIPSLSGGGAERATATIAENLDTSIFEPLLVLERRGPQVYMPRSDLRVECLEATSTKAALRPLVGVLRAFRPELVYAALPHLNILAAVACQLTRPRPKLVVSVHNNQERELADVPNGAAMRRIMPWVYRRADAVVVVSDGIAAELAPLVKDTSKVAVVPNPIAVAEVQRLSRAEVSHPWVGGRHAVITAMGRLTPQKGFAVLLRAFAIVHARRPDARLLVLGDGEQRRELEELSRQLGTADAVEFLGVQANPFAWVGQSACFALSSHWEGFGMAIVEAMAVGTPVVSTDCPYGPAEILEGGARGVLVAPGAVDELAAGLLRVLDDAPLREHLGRVGKERAWDFDTATVVPGLGERFLRLAGPERLRWLEPDSVAAGGGA